VPDQYEAYLNFDMGREVPLNLKEVVAKVKDADVVIFAGGISPAVEGEEMPVSIPGFKGGDRTTIELPEIQTNLLRELKKAGKRVVFVNYSGSALALAREAELCDAILQAWYPGQAGGTAVADILLGNYNPAGRLPITFYKSTAQLPDFEDYSMKNRTYRYMQEAPLFPFGHGLSYTTFNYDNAQLSSTELADDQKVTLTIPVSNIGKMDGQEVVQVYLRRVGDTEGPSHALRAFKRTAIAQGETKEVSFELTKDDFEWFDTVSSTMRPIEGEYEILYGGTSDLKALKSLTINIK
jgi:beta-glucosidase